MHKPVDKCVMYVISYDVKHLIRYTVIRVWFRNKITLKL